MFITNEETRKSRIWQSYGQVVEESPVMVKMARTPQTPPPPPPSHLPPWAGLLVPEHHQTFPPSWYVETSTTSTTTSVETTTPTTTTTTTTTVTSSTPTTSTSTTTTTTAPAPAADFSKGS